MDGDYDVMIVDRTVPQLGGLGVVKMLRAAGVKAPVLYLIAIDDAEDRPESLEAGGNDYLVEPFAFTELIARLNALVRRTAITAAQIRLSVGDLELDLVKRTAMRAAFRLDLQPQELRLLEFLMRNAGQIVTRTMVLENVWSFHFTPQTNIVESHSAGSGQRSIGAFRHR